MKNIIVKIKIFVKKILFGKSKNYLTKFGDYLMRDVREEDFDMAISSFLKKIKIEKILKEDPKFFAVGILGFFVVIWTSYNIFVPVVYSEEDGIFNLQIKEKIEVNIPEEGEINKIKTEDLNRYKLKSQEKECQDNKEKKITSSLCGKDDEEEVKRQQIEAEKKKIISKPKINAPKPHVFEKDSLGRRVCNKKNDKPGKSKQGKGKHMDMECCLDPDEIPNPHCYYDPAKYGKYL